MAVYHGPQFPIDPIQNDLIFHVDAADPDSISGYSDGDNIPDGAIFNDLTENYDATIWADDVTNRVKWSDTYGGAINLGTVEQITNFIAIPNGTLNSQSAWAIEFWTMRLANSTTQHTMLTGGGGVHSYPIHCYGYPTSITFFNAFQAVSALYSTSLNVPYHYVFTNSNGVGHIYLNGSLLKEENQTSLITLQDTSIVAGQHYGGVGYANFASVASHLAKYFIIRLYRKELSPADIAHNFTLERDRFLV